MIDRKDLKVGLVTEDGLEVTAIGTKWLLYIRDNTEYAMYIYSFCSDYSIKKEKVEVVRWVNVYADSYSTTHPAKEEAKSNAGPCAIAVAVKQVGSYEV